MVSLQGNQIISIVKDTRNSRFVLKWLHKENTELIVYVWATWKYGRAGGLSLGSVCPPLRLSACLQAPPQVVLRC